MEGYTNNEPTIPSVEYIDAVVFQCSDTNIAMEYYTENIIHWVDSNIYDACDISMEYNVRPIHSDVLKKLVSTAGPATIRSVVENLPYVIEDSGSRIQVSIGTIAAMALQIKTCKDWPTSDEDRLEQFRDIYKRAVELSSMFSSIVYVNRYD